jgi:hypothetical protein
MAAGRDGLGLGCAFIHASIGSSSAGGTLTMIPVDPIAGRPGGRFRVSETIDFGYE